MLTYRNLTQCAYDAVRYQVLLNVEETGDSKEIAYLDSKGTQQGQVLQSSIDG